jgi:hypothetical protein
VAAAEDVPVRLAFDTTVLFFALGFAALIVIARLLLGWALESS